MRKKVLFVIGDLGCGGTNRSLQNLLLQEAMNQYDIYIYPLNPVGVFAKDFSKYHILNTSMWVKLRMSNLKSLTIFKRLLAVLIKTLNKLTKGSLEALIFQIFANKEIKSREYDAVVAYNEGSPTAFLCNAKHENKIAWVHCDYRNYQQSSPGLDELSIYEKYHRIVCVSQFTRNSFISCYPSIEGRVTYVYNILDSKSIIELSKISGIANFDETEFNIVTIGRIDTVKRFSIIPEIAGQLRDAGCRFHWYVIGPVANEVEYAALQKGIRDYDISSYITMTGEVVNPYPYIKNAQLLVNTSISEACPYVINEAKLLHTPVVCSDFGSAWEFVNNAKDGYVCSIKEMGDTIINIIKNKNVFNMLCEGLQDYCYDNGESIAKVECLLYNLK